MGHNQDDCRVYFDVTKQMRQSHSSGLNRVSTRLRKELAHLEGVQLIPVKWSMPRCCYCSTDTGEPVRTGRSSDIFFTPEVFALSERPFARRWLTRFNGGTGCMFYDAIPFFHPQTTWPKSVRRFPALLKDLNSYDQVFYISEQAAKDAIKASEKLGFTVPVGSILTLGSDYPETPLKRASGEAMTLLQVGILEPRKGQALFLDACERLWESGHQFKAVFLGRVNPHFGKPIVEKIQSLRLAGRDVLHVADADDTLLGKWLSRASLLVSPSFAEGFGLPVLEALWAGCPVLASRQPACRFVQQERGCLVLDPLNTESLHHALQSLLENPERLKSLQQAIDPASLPRWRTSAIQLMQAF